VKDKAFTLIEVMIVVAILSLIIALALPNFIRAKNTASANACIENLRLIQSAVQIWALDTYAASTATPGTTSELAPYIKSWPYCGLTANTYEIPSVGSPPVCPVVSRRATHHL